MEAASREADQGLILLVGNPNVGKSALFGHLTGKYVTVSNYPGTTVDVIRGRFRRAGREAEVIDTPGIYSLQPQSEDELVTRDILLNHPDATVVLVLDAKNLQRGLVVAQQLSELGVRFCIALNMMDEALSHGLKIDVAALAEAVGVPVVPTVATSGRGVEELARSFPAAGPGHLQSSFPPEIAEGVRQIGFILSESARKPVGPFLALSYLTDPGSLPAALKAAVDPDGKEIIDSIGLRIRRSFRSSLRETVSRVRVAELNQLLERVLQRSAGPAGGFSSRLGALAVHPVWGLGFAAVALVLLYELVGVFGAGTLVDLLEGELFEGIINPAAISLADRFVPWAWLRDFLVGQYGLVTMALTYSLAIILPIVGTFFIAFGLLEDSGFMPRLAVMANRFFRRLGLHGKAILPLILGLGCTTMATLTTRIMETRKERILVTMLLALGVPCSAQLGVILGMLGTVSGWGVVIWLAVVGLVLIVTGIIGARVLPGAASDFILELPPLRLPGLRNILVKTGARIEWYLREAVPLFVLGTVILFALDRLSLLVLIRAAAAPVVGNFLGLPLEATDAFLIGFLRRDYGAAGLFEIQRAGLMGARQVVVSLVIITLFVPCIANFFVMVKERGLQVAVTVAVIVFLIALLVGGCLNWLLLWLGVSL